VRKVAGAVLVVGLLGLAVNGLTSGSASAATSCFVGLSAGFRSPDGRLSTTFANGNTGLSAAASGGASLVSLVLHLADATTDTTAFPAGTTSATDVHDPSRKVITTYDICIDTTGATTTTTASTTTGPTTTPAPTTTTTTGTTTTTSPRHHHHRSNKGSHADRERSGDDQRDGGDHGGVSRA